MRVRSHSGRRAASLIAPVAVAGLLLLSGCVVRSLNPWFTDEVVVFEERLLGEWVAYDEDDGESEAVLRIEREGEAGYLLRYHALKEEPEPSLFAGRVANINGVLYLEFKPELELESAAGVFVVPAFGLARVSVAGDQLLLALLDADALGAAFSKRGWILEDVRRAESEPTVIAATAQLTGWLRSLPADAEFFESPGTFRKRSD
jgi:hypothetical protein